MKNNKLLLLVISSYPLKGYTHGAGTVGIASYTKNTLLGILRASKNSGTIISVLAEKLVFRDSPLQGQSLYREKAIKVNRVWKRNSLTAYFSLLKEIIKRPSYKTVLFEFELSMFGGSLNLIPLPFFLLLLKLLGRKVYFVFHQVVTDINDLAIHAGLKPKSLQSRIINIFIFLFYRLTCLSVNKAIVFEEYLKGKLEKFADSSKIIVIPHGVEKFSEKISYKEARKKLGLGKEFIILYFGFIAWYKGTDWLVKQRVGKKVKIIIAGGPNPNHIDKKFYQKYVEFVTSSGTDPFKDSPFTVTGFVPEKQIPLYFAAADVVVFPYRTFMSSSGPLSLAYSFKKPILVSEYLKGIFENQDATVSLKSAKLKQNDLIFKLSKKDFQNKIKQYLRTVHYGDSPYKKFSRELCEKRSFERIGKMYLKELFIC